MKPEERNQFAERWLEEALTQCGAAEPRPGFEARILANLATAKAERRPVWRWRFAVTGACAAVVFLTIGLALLRRPVGPPNEHLSATNSAASPTASVKSAPAQIAHLTADAPSPQGVAERQKPRTGKRPPQTFAGARKEPQQAQFPAAMPLSGQQTLVLAYVSATPAEELMKISNEQRAWQDHVQSGAKATQIQDLPLGPDINQLHFPPRESGNTQAGSLESR